MSEEPISPEQCRGARTVVQWSLAQLAAAANVSQTAIADFEAELDTPAPRDLTALRTALEAAGAEFTAQPAFRSIGPEDEARGGPEAPEPPDRQLDD